MYILYIITPIYVLHHLNNQPERTYLEKSHKKAGMHPSDDDTKGSVHTISNTRLLKKTYTRSNPIRCLTYIASGGFALPLFVVLICQLEFTAEAFSLHPHRRHVQASSSSYRTFQFGPMSLRQRKRGGGPSGSSSKAATDDELATSTGVLDLQLENKRLRDKIRLLQEMNVALENGDSGSKIIIESFEGEGSLGDEQWCDVDGSADGECPIEPNVSFRDALRDRAYWLVGLLVAQSCSSFFLARNEELLQTYPTIIYFLTMLVGAGGNAGNQASVRVIRGIALGAVNEKTQQRFLNREFRMAIALSCILSLAGFLRAAFFQTPFAETVAITSALSLIVFTSVCLGAVLPLVLKVS